MAAVLTISSLWLLLAMLGAIVRLARTRPPALRQARLRGRRSAEELKAGGS